MKKLSVVTLILATLMSNSHAFPQGGMAVFDVGTFTQLYKEYQELTKIYQEMSDAKNYLSQLNSDSLKWMSSDFNNYFRALNTLRSGVERANDILSTQTAESLEQYNKLYPGYNGLELKNNARAYRQRSQSLLKLLSTQIEVANDALANQKNIDNADKSSAAAVANATLASLSNLNTQISSELRAANAYRASQIQSEIEQKEELKRFIGEPYRRHDPSKLKTCVGECER